MLTYVNMAEKQKGMLARVDQSNTSNKTNMAFEMGAWQSQSVDKQDDVISQQIYRAFLFFVRLGMKLSRKLGLVKDYKGKV